MSGQVKKYKNSKGEIKLEKERASIRYHFALRGISDVRGVSFLYQLCSLFLNGAETIDKPMCC